MKTKHFISETDKTFNDDDLTITHYISTTTPDRYGDIVNPAGMDASNYIKNPVVLFGHRSNALVIGKNLELQIKKNGVSAITKFADTQQGREIYKLNRDGFLNAWSIGFIPLKEVQKKDEASGKTYNHIEEWELLEYSSVPIPANPDCLNLIMKDLKDASIKDIIIQELADYFITDISDYLRLITDIETLQEKVIELENNLTSHDEINDGIKSISDKMINLEGKIVKLESKVSNKLFDLIKFIKSL
jgi:HK97 family phage prohead protease